MMGLDAMIFVFRMLSFKSAFSPSSRSSLVPLSFLPLGWFGSTCKCSGDVVDTAKKHQSITMELEAQGKDEERQEEKEVTEEPKRFTTQEIAMGFSVFEQAFSFWGSGLEHWMLHEDGSSHSECNPIVLRHLWWESESYYPDIWIVFFKRVDRTKPSKEPGPVPSTSGVSEIAACPPSPITGDPSAVPSLPPLPPASGTLACSLDASPCVPAVVLYFCTFQGIIL